MTGRPRRRILITASASDIYDGLLRLVVDAQRFGFALDEVSTSGRADASASIRMTIMADGALDCANIESRFSRHPTIRDVQAVELENDGARP